MTATIIEIDKSVIDRWWNSGMLVEADILAIDYDKVTSGIAFVASSPAYGTLYALDLVDSSGRSVGTVAGMIGGKEVDKLGEELAEVLRAGPSCGSVYKLS